MDIEHKVTYWDPGVELIGGPDGPQAIERRLNELGEQGWSTVGVAASPTGGYVFVLTRPSRVDTGEIQLVRLAAFHRVGQAVKRSIELLQGTPRRSLSRPALESPDEAGLRDL